MNKLWSDRSMFFRYPWWLKSGISVESEWNVMWCDRSLLFPYPSWLKSGFLVDFNCGMQGDLYDHESLVKAIKQVDVVISTVGQMQLADQSKIIDAIKEAGNVKVTNVYSLILTFFFLNFNCFYLQIQYIRLLLYIYIYILIIIIIIINLIKKNKL